MTGGRAWRFGDDVDTDGIVPGRHLAGDLEHIARHVMEGVRPGFAGMVRPGDVVVAGRNFGTGSSREMAPRALRHAGVSAVVAVSFARIFYRNAINVGLPPVECPRAREIEEGWMVAVDLESGVVRAPEHGLELPCVAIPREIRPILDAGGLEAYLAAGGPG